ncbi:hypothetical protein BSQ38_05030 [Pediococcus damnosus]|uniref:MFS transporter n=1 Tax=Pediococcus damnosus TaxID=51663 RepID=UPI000C1C8549|nr:MFS transporter [Pediococcus damnosus]PIO81055.1 hypothetical protein BSQ38_05030 [Pediococcus damnosus]
MNKKSFIFFYGLNSIGQNFYYLAIPMIVYAITKSASYMGIMTILQTLPVIMFGAIIGTIVDNFNPRHTLELTLVFQVGLLLFMYLLSIQRKQILFVYLIGFLLSVDRQFFKSTVFTLIPTVFDDAEKGNEWISSLNSLSSIVSPFIGAGVIALVGVNFTILMNAVFAFLFLLTVLWSKREMNVPILNSNLKNETHRSIIDETADGFKLIKGNSLMKHMIVIVLLSNLADAGIVQLLIFYMSSDLKVSQSLISTVIGISGIGAFIGTLVPQLFKKMQHAKVMQIGLLINNFGIFLLLIPNWRVVPIALLISRIGGMLFFIKQNTLIHVTVNGHMYGRINGIFSNLSELSTPISVFLLMNVANIGGGYSGIVVSCVLTAVVTTLSLMYKSNCSYVNKWHISF